MIPNIVRSVAVVMLAIGPTNSIAQESTDPTVDLSTVVAMVNDHEITVGHVIAAKNELPDEFTALPLSVLFPAVIDQLVQQELLAQSFDDDIPLTVVSQVENTRRELLAINALDNVFQDLDVEEALRALYDERYDNESQLREYNAAHILVESEDEANAIIAELEEGADFATLAREKSNGPSGPRGGDLGWFGPGKMLASFQSAVEALEPGDISEPVETQYGFHVIKLNETRQSNQPEFEAVRGELLGELQQRTVEEHIATLTKAAEIDRTMGNEIDLGAIDALSLEGQR